MQISSSLFWLLFPFCIANDSSNFVLLSFVFNVIIRTKSIEHQPIPYFSSSKGCLKMFCSSFPLALLRYMCIWIIIKLSSFESIFKIAMFLLMIIMNWQSDSEEKYHSRLCKKICFYELIQH